MALAVVAAACAVALLDQSSGVRTWFALRADLDAASARIEGLRQEISKSEGAAAALRDDPLAQERAIREDLGLARPAETILRVSEPESATHRIP